MMPLLAYWDIRSLAQPSRNLLIYKGVQFEDKRYKHGPPPAYGREEWLNEKFTLGFAFPNIPYYVDDEVKITQSVAILRYLGRKHDLAGRNDEETMELDLLEQQARDLNLTIPYESVNVPKSGGGLDWYVHNTNIVLEPWAKHLADRKWALGDRLTYVDFLLYEGLDWHREFKPDAVQRYPEIVSYVERFEQLPNLKQLFASEKYKKWPILGPMRPWGKQKWNELRTDDRQLRRERVIYSSRYVLCPNQDYLA